ncbi:MAG: hypothetical protein N3E51_03865 [Candidatus Micrarchaeota archaeon]|nr:hypothetical protein [Candidatus Micrarchaeota archaeon]
MGKNVFLLGFLALILFLAFGCAGQAVSQDTQKPQAEAAPSPPTSSSQPASEPSSAAPAPPKKQESEETGMPDQKVVRGRVNLDEVGGESLKVSSVFKLNSSVEPDGSFSTVVSATNIQLIFVNDKDGQLRATAISVPDEPLVVDAKSTTKALLWVGFSVKSEEGSKALAYMEKLNCYPDLYAYVKANLKKKSLSQISNISNAEYVEIQKRCTDEILGLMKQRLPK